MGRLDRENDSAYEDAMEEAVDIELSLGKKDDNVSLVTPIATVHPTLGILNMGQLNIDVEKDDLGIVNRKQLKQQREGKDLVEPYSQELEGTQKENSVNKDRDGEGDKKEDENLIPNENQYLVFDRDGKYLMDKSKWPILKLPNEQDSEEPMEGLTQEDAIFNANVDTFLGGKSLE